jgi:small subunit ribosomal protein S17
MQEEQNNQQNETENPSAGNDPLNLNEGFTSGSGSTEAAAGSSAEDGEKVPHRKIRVGVVVSNKMEKSITVKVERRVRHKLYKKYFNKSKKFMAHDENNECGIGDTVRIVETRPLSARKRWRLDAIVEKAK